VTDQCHKWNADGTLKNKEGSHDKEKKAHKAFIQLKSKTEYNKKLLKKLLKKDKSTRRRAIVLMTLPIWTAILPERMGKVAQRNYMKVIT
jgi:hypothetical protein